MISISSISDSTVVFSDSLFSLQKSSPGGSVSVQDQKHVVVGNVCHGITSSQVLETLLRIIPSLCLL